MSLLRAAILDRAGFRHGFPTRDTTDPEILAGLGAQRVIQVKQIHGANVVDAAEATGREADAIVGRSGDDAVGIRVADCVPVLVADEETGDVAAIHAGWRGVVAGVVGAGLARLGGRARLAAIGPCIGACCFEVGADVGEQIGFVVQRSGDKAYVDLRAAVRAQLLRAGLEDARIEDVAGCTKHEPERFHSFRRDGANSGRMLAAIVARAPTRTA